MRGFVIILVMLQLVLRSCAVPHCHAHAGNSDSGDHAKRPHIHVAGHLRSHETGHHHAGHGHSHQHADQLDHSLPANPQPADPTPLPSEHDQDAVYVGSESFTASASRIQVPEPIDTGWFLSVLDAGNQPFLPHLMTRRGAGPPGKSAGTPRALLPHLLRI